MEKPTGNTVKNVAKTSKSGIIKEELPRKVKSLSNAVDWNIIQTKRYTERFIRLSDNPKVQKSVETRVKWALNNRDGTTTEEIYAVSLDDGREISRITNQNNDSFVVRTDSFTNAINVADKAGTKILLLHNHPKGMPPSLSDINLLTKDKIYLD